MGKGLCGATGAPSRVKKGLVAAPKVPVPIYTQGKPPPLSDGDSCVGSFNTYLLSTY